MIFDVAHVCLTLDAEVDGVTGGLSLAVLCPAGVGSVVLLLNSLQHIANLEELGLNYTDHN